MARNLAQDTYIVAHVSTLSAKGGRARPKTIHPAVEGIKCCDVQGHQCLPAITVDGIKGVWILASHASAFLHGPDSAAASAQQGSLYMYL